MTFEFIGVNKNLGIYPILFFVIAQGLHEVQRREVENGSLKVGIYFWMKRCQKSGTQLL